MELIIDGELELKTVLYLLEKKLSMSHKAISRLKRLENGIMLNGERVSVRRVLHSGDVLYLESSDLESEQNPYLQPVDIPLDILYEDDDIIIPCKSANMPMHQSFGHENDSLANALAFYFRDRPFIFRAVNRLDRDTSGVCLIAKNRDSATKLGMQISRGEMKKCYTAILLGCLNEQSGAISSAIKRKADSIIERVVCPENDPHAQQALTRYECIQRYEGLTLVRAMPKTGRTHQLRVHFASINAPILGDSLYSKPSELISRQALHADTLTFNHPTSGKTMEITAPIPPDMAKVLENAVKI